MILWLTPAQLRALIAHSERETPHEACGLIGGTIEGEIFRACVIVPIANRAENPREHFVMDESALVRAMLDFESNGWTLVGIFHSHPNSEPIPSPEDIRRAFYPGTPYMIIGRTGALAVWEIHHGDVTPVTLHISESRPETPLPPPSRAVSTAVLITAAFAFIFVLTLALALLPPAPIITP